VLWCKIYLHLLFILILFVQATGKLFWWFIPCNTLKMNKPMPASVDLLTLDRLYYVKLLSDSSADGILLLGKNYRILAYNKPAEKLSAELYKTQYLHGEDFRKYLNPLAEKYFHAQFDSALRGNTTEEVFEMEKDEKKLFLKVEMTPVFNNTNEVFAITVITRDITDMQVLNARLNEVTAMQNHQVRRPVANMLSVVALLDNGNLTEEQAEYLQLLKISISQLEEEIQNIVKKARNA